MRMKNAKRTIGIGVVVWLLFFGWWFNGYLYINWNFRLFSLNSWRFLFNEINHGWRISNKAKEFKGTQTAKSNVSPDSTKSIQPTQEKEKKKKGLLDKILGDD